MYTHESTEMYLHLSELLDGCHTDKKLHLYNRELFLDGLVEQ